MVTSRSEDVKGNNINKNIEISESLNEEANIVMKLVIQGAFKIAKDFIDFIEEKERARINQ